MAWDFGPERSEAIRVLQEQIERAKVRLDAIGATADAREVSYEARDAADLAWGELHDETSAMEEALGKLCDGDPRNDAVVMAEALRILRRDIRK